mgnify:CR=1 FL=1
MTIILKNKDTLTYKEFKFKCSIGKNGLTQNKIEGAQDLMWALINSPAFLFNH